MPRRAALQPEGGDETFTNLLEGADIIYFPAESVVLLPRSSAVWKLLDALKRDEGSFALGWDIGVGDEKVRRALLSEATKSGAQILPLHVQPDVAAGPTPPEFVPPPEDFEHFARQFQSRGLKEGALRAEYESALRRQQLAAEKIASYFKEHRTEKIIVFLRRDEMRGDFGVPYFVAKKTKARQLILNPKRDRGPAPGLLARY
ncbi:MAG TPA: hypothetical protein VLO30_01555 [Chthoniobacterales bacterium]|nr:hypothetical protein [Chthoniobacterales bacterium]